MEIQISYHPDAKYPWQVTFKKETFLAINSFSKVEWAFSYAYQLLTKTACPSPHNNARKEINHAPHKPLL